MNWLRLSESLRESGFPTSSQVGYVLIVYLKCVFLLEYKTFFFFWLAICFGPNGSVRANHCVEMTFCPWWWVFRMPSWDIHNVTGVSSSWALEAASQAFKCFPAGDVCGHDGVPCSVLTAGMRVSVSVCLPGDVLFSVFLWLIVCRLNYKIREDPQQPEVLRYCDSFCSGGGCREATLWVEQL